MTISLGGHGNICHHPAGADTKLLLFIITYMLASQWSLLADTTPATPAGVVSADGARQAPPPPPPAHLNPPTGPLTRAALEEPPTLGLAQMCLGSRPPDGFVVLNDNQGFEVVLVFSSGYFWPVTGASLLAKLLQGDNSQVNVVKLINLENQYEMSNYFPKFAYEQPIRVVSFSQFPRESIYHNTILVVQKKGYYRYKVKSLVVSSAATSQVGQTQQTVASVNITELKIDLEDLLEDGRSELSEDLDKTRMYHMIGATRTLFVMSEPNPGYYYLFAYELNTKSLFSPARSQVITAPKITFDLVHSFDLTNIGGDSKTRLITIDYTVRNLIGAKVYSSDIKPAAPAATPGTNTTTPRRKWYQFARYLCECSRARQSSQRGFLYWLQQRTAFTISSFVITVNVFLTINLTLAAIYIYFYQLARLKVATSR